MRLEAFLVILFLRRWFDFFKRMYFEIWGAWVFTKF